MAFWELFPSVRILPQVHTPVPTVRYGRARMISAPAPRKLVEEECSCTRGRPLSIFINSTHHLSRTINRKQLRDSFYMLPEMKRKWGNPYMTLCTWPSLHCTALAKLKEAARVEDDFSDTESDCFHIRPEVLTQAPRQKRRPHKKGNKAPRWRPLHVTFQTGSVWLLCLISLDWRW